MEVKELFPAAAIVLLAAAPDASALQDGAKAALGELVPEHEFRPFVAGGDGRTKLSELRGQPVLLVNWTDTDFGRGAADKAEDVAKDLMPDGLIVVLRETHNMKALELEAAVMRLYPGTPAWVAPNQELPVEYQDNGPPPDVALVGVDGRLLVAGSYTADLGEAVKQAKGELKRRKAGWGEHPTARRARALAFGAGRLADARALLEEALRTEPDAPELLAAQAEVASRWQSALASVRALLASGQPTRALADARELADASVGHSEWQDAAAALLAELATEEAQRALALDAELAKLLAPLQKKPPKAAQAEKLARFAEGEAAGTPVGARAAHLAEVARLAAGD